MEREKAMERKKKNRVERENKQFESSVKTQEMQKVRSDPAYREAEGIRNAERHQKLRLDQGYKESERHSNAQGHQKLRTDVEYRELERSRDAEGHQALRQDPDFRRQEKERDCEHHQVLRQDPGLRRMEQERDSEHHQALRQDPEFRRQEQERDSEHHQALRQDPEFRRQEQERDSEHHQALRQDPEFRIQEQERDSEHHQALRSNFRNNWESVLQEFKTRKKDGPTNICVCCGGLFFKKSMKASDSSKFSAELQVKVLCLWNASDGVVLFCSTCHSVSGKGKVPKLSLSNGLSYPVIPEELKELTALEERLTAPRLPFMMLRPLGWDRQFGLKGNIVNVPVDVCETVKVLPRKMCESSVVHLALMRRMDYKLPYMFETIRPMKVYAACKYLVNTPLYKQEGITLSSEWDELTEPIAFDESSCTAEVDDEDENMDTTAPSKAKPEETEAHSSSEEESRESLQSNNSEETLLISDSDMLSQALKYAAGQNKKPISLLWDLNAEVLTFPSIYCGQMRNVAKNLTYTDIAKSEARRYDRRACTPQKLLYSFKKSQTQQIVDSITVSLRKKSGTTQVTASNLLNNEFVLGLEQRNEGLVALKNIRSSPSYWDARQKEVFATIRQLGIPTFFHTVSAMESHWPELIVILKLVLDGKQLSELEAAALTQAEKTDLIRRDPITCARYFDTKSHDYFTPILKSDAVFDKNPLMDYFVRVEFQHRGSPHLHILLWLKDSPKYYLDDPFYCVKFIDRFITTERTELSLEFQQHRHTHCCR